LASLDFGQKSSQSSLFRFDILKPWPIKWIDQKVVGGFGIMLDDVLAGLFSAGILYYIVNL